MSGPTPSVGPHDPSVDAAAHGGQRQLAHRWPWIILIVATAAIIIVTIILSAQDEDRNSGRPSAMEDVSQADQTDESDEDVLTILEEAAEFAGAGDIADAGTSLFLDGEGEDVGSGTVTVDDMVSVLFWAEAPEHVVTMMSQTRALDGMQSTEWETEWQGTVTAQWTYHPDNGLDIILTVEPPDGFDT